MSRFTLDVSELDEYAQVLETAAHLEGFLATNTVRRWSEKVVREARRIVPVRTGRLRNSIAYDARTRHIQATAPYAGFVEFGTSRMAARPYLRPALRKYRKPFRDDVKDAAVTVLTKAGARKLRFGGVRQFTLGQQLDVGRFEP